jgi:hypothetical protein
VIGKLDLIQYFHVANLVSPYYLTLQRGQYPSDDSKFVGHDEIELEQHHHQQQAQHIFEPRSILMDGEFASNAVTLKKEVIKNH